MNWLRNKQSTFWTVTNTLFKDIIIYYIYVQAIVCQTVEERRRTRTYWKITLYMLDFEALQRFYFVIEEFWSNVPWIIIRYTRSWPQPKMWWISRLDLFLNEDIACIFYINDFVGILQFKEHTSLAVFSQLVKKAISISNEPSLYSAELHKVRHGWITAKSDRPVA